MNGGTKLALAIAIMWIAMVAFFFAFHPSGVVDASGKLLQNPLDILKWLADQFSGNVAPTKAATSDVTQLQTDLIKDLTVPIPPGVAHA